MAHRIGPHTFAYMFGEVPVITDAVEVIQKPGEDGHILRRVGKRAPTFELRTQGAYATKDDARAAFQTFGEMVGVEPGLPPDVGEIAYTLEKDDFNYTTDPLTKYRVQILEVRQDRLTKKACIAGTSNTWWLECSWSLILVPTV